MTQRRVIRADSDELAELELSGWRIVARSWGAGLRADAIDHLRLKTLIDRAARDCVLRELTAADSDAVSALDAATLDDYPGDIATAHRALTPEQASPTAAHRGWGAFTPAGELVAFTFTFPGHEVTETDFTVVHHEWRGRGIGSAVKAVSIVTLAADGHRYFRTGGSVDNTASLAANRSVGYVIDEDWLTVGPPARHD